MVHLHSFTFNDFAENTYILWDDAKRAVIIDPGCYYKQEQQQLEEFVRWKKLEVQQVLLTHGHIDHVLGVDYVCERYKVGLTMAEEDLPTLKAVPTYAPNYGFPLYKEVEPSSYCAVGEVISYGEIKLKVLFVPGHSVGHIAFYAAEEGFVIGGDVLFAGSIGRTDLPGGSFEVLEASIKRELFVLPKETKIYPGHGPVTTVGEEVKSNPYVRL